MKSTFSSIEIVTAIDTIWVLVAAFLVFIMQLGFAMLEAGFTRVKNIINMEETNEQEKQRRSEGLCLENGQGT